MKKLIALVMALMMMVCCTAIFAEEKQTLVMGTNASFPPYEFWEGEEIVGIDVEICAAIAEYLGMDFEVMDMEFDSLIAAVNAGKVDVVMAGMTVTEDRATQVNFSDSYATGVQVVIVKEDSPIKTVDDLMAGEPKYTIGVQQATTGDLYCTWDLEDYGKATINRYMNGNEAVMALVAGKIDCVVIDNEPAKAYVAANPGLKILETEYITENYAAAIAKENVDFVAKFNEALAALTADGTIPAIIEAYIPSQTEEAAAE